MVLTVEAWAGVACWAAGGVLAWTAVIIAVFGTGWWRIPRRRRRYVAAELEDLFNTLPPTRWMAEVSSRD